jgi:ribosome-binding protein aMBF1 (putative translation factor)
MSINVAPITPQLLVWARNRLGFSIDDTANLINVKVTQYQEWENGKAFPTTKQAKNFEKK